MAEPSVPESMVIPGKGAMGTENLKLDIKWAAKYKDAPLYYRWPTLAMGRSYWAVRFLAEAIKKAWTTDVEKVIEAWGKVTMRACDHQLIGPGVAAEVQPTSKFFDFPYVGTPTIIPAADITTPPAETGNPRCE